MTIKINQMTHEMNNTFNLNLSDRACQHIKKVLSKANCEYLELTIRNTGCSGYRYDFNLLNAEQATIALKKGHFLLQKPLDIQLLIDPAHFPLLNGLYIDYGSENENLGQHLIYQNPNESGHCGCGESFYVEKK